MSVKGNEKREFPKNIRQIGEAGKDKRIYLEDYAISYIRQVKGAVLLGEMAKIRGSRCYFISGAIEIPDGNFNEENWQYVMEEAANSFQGLSVVGWFLKAEEIPEELNEEDMRVYKEHFPGREAILVVYNDLEKEEGVYLVLDGFLRKQNGYYIYYEKNARMQEYLIAKNEGKSVEKETVVSDEAIQNFRKIFEGKRQKKEEPETAEGKEGTSGKEGKPLKEAEKEEETRDVPEEVIEDAEKKATEKPKIMSIRIRKPGEKAENTKTRVKTLHFLYTASTFMVLTILVIGITMINNYDKMKEMEQTMARMTEYAQVNAGVMEEEETEETTLPMKQTVIDVRTGETEILNGVLEESEMETGEQEGETEGLVNASADSQAEIPGDAAASQSVSSIDDTGSALSQTAGSGTAGLLSESEADAAVGTAGQAKTVSGEEAGNQDGSAQGVPDGQSAALESQSAETDAGEGGVQAAAAPVHASQATYTIKFGDTLADICNRYYGTLDKLQDICDLNNITDPNSILPGQKLVLP